jgi:hypothetical protein
MEIFTIVTWKIWKQQNGHILQGEITFFGTKKDSEMNFFYKLRFRKTLCQSNFMWL